MDQKLGRGAETVTDDAPTHPGILLLEAIKDSHTRRGVKRSEDNVLRAGVELELAADGVGDGTINGYSAEHQRVLSNMLEKDAWRS